MRLNDTSTNVLVSYAYLRNNERLLKFLYDKTETGEINLMIDSGAFTVFNSKDEKKKFTLDDYCEFLKQHGHICEKYVMLDVIDSTAKTKENYEYMLRKGLNPMFVFTMRDNDFDYLKIALANNLNVCIAGGVKSKGNWTKKRFQDAIRVNPDAKLHGLGFVIFPLIFKLPIHSVDSSSWIQQGSKYGWTSIFTGQGSGIHRWRYQLIRDGEKKLTRQQTIYLEEYGITPAHWIEPKNHRGNNSIPVFLTATAFVKYQRYAKRHDVDLFLAAGSIDHIKIILTIDKLIKTNKLTYDNYRNYSFPV